LHKTALEGTIKACERHLPIHNSSTSHSPDKQRKQIHTENVNAETEQHVFILAVQQAGSITTNK